LRIGTELVDAATISWMEAVTDEVTVPREAMGFGDVKFMAAIGAFVGWEGVLFALMGSSLIGLLAALALTATGRREWSSRIYYGPFLSMAALIWVLGGREWFLGWLYPAV
jgi:leader peptidase (prepilin peptidase)/N-methyltransferase